MKNCLLVQLYLYFRCCRDAGCCEYKSSLKRSMKNKSSSTADVVKPTISLNTRLCAHRLFLFGSTSWNVTFLFCRIPTPQNSPNNQKSQILLRNVCVQQKIMFFFLAGIPGYSSEGCTLNGSLLGTSSKRKTCFIILDWFST